MAEEKQFENKIKRYLRSIGVYPADQASDQMKTPMIGWYTKVWGGGYQKSGIPDMIACVNGVFIAIEIKASNGRPSELQKLNVDRINRSGGIAVILYPEGFKDFQKIMEGVINCNSHIPKLIALKSANSNTNCNTLTG